jgi:hypothetical protein
VVLLVAPASAQSARQWIFDDNPEAPALTYGTPDSDDLLIAFTCEPDEKRMTIVEAVGTVNIEVIGAPNPRLFALLKAGPSLSIEVAGEKETLPLAGAAPHIPLFEKLCFGRK